MSDRYPPTSSSVMLRSIPIMSAWEMLYLIDITMFQYLFFNGCSPAVYEDGGLRICDKIC